MFSAVKRVTYEVYLAISVGHSKSLVDINSNGFKGSWCLHVKVDTTIHNAAWWNFIIHQFDAHLVEILV